MLGVFPPSLRAEDLHQWSLPGVPAFQAQLIAADGLRATLSVPGRGKTVIPFQQMSAADAAYVQDWRKENPRAPLVDPERLAPWPAEAAAESIEVQMSTEGASAARWTYESVHFVIESDLKLPLPVVREIAAVFETTRAAIIALPLGLHLGHESRKYPVALISNVMDYSKAGGNTGSGGTYNGASGQMLVLLPNLGIKPGTNGLGVDFQRNIFILKHEVTHQVLGRWQPFLPMWLREGFCECMAATPYTRGRYSFQGLDAAMHDYVLKWRTNPNQRELQFIPPAQLMDLDENQWNAGVAALSAYPFYNSAAVLTHYFLHADGKGDGAGIAAYFDDIRRGIPGNEAEANRLLRGRTRQNLAGDLQAYGRKLGLNLKIEKSIVLPSRDSPAPAGIPK